MTNTKTIYIAGPMTGHKNFNEEAFDNAERRLSNRGWDVISPIAVERVDGVVFTGRSGNESIKEMTGETIKDIVERDISLLCHQCDAIYMLRGWKKSKGATAECYVAKWLGLDIYYEDGRDALLNLHYEQ
jgi:ATP-dependent Zn protease